MDGRGGCMDWMGKPQLSRLRSLGIDSPGSLLVAARRPQGRRLLAERSGLPASWILRAAHVADLTRIAGVGSRFARLLAEAGVDSVRELRNRNADNLARKLALINAERGLCRRSPGPELVQEWIDRAGRLSPALEY